MLFKMLFIGYLFGISSERKLVKKEAEVSVKDYLADLDKSVEEDSVDQ